MCVSCVELVSRSKDYIRSRMKIGSVVYLYTPVLPRALEIEGIYAIWCIFAFFFFFLVIEPVWPSGKALGW